MKLKSLVWTLGLKPKPKTYGTERIQFHLSREGTVDFERWKHPKGYFCPLEQSLIDQLRQFIQPGDAVIDIGAHTGDFTLPLALAAGPTGIVFAWEPNPYVYAVLEKNAALNREKTNIVPFQAAAAPTPGLLEFHYSDPGFCNGGYFEGLSRWRHGHPYRLTVPARRVTDWLTQRYPERLSRIRFVKIDAEGYDLEILRSIDPILRQRRPVIHVEVYRHSTAENRRELWNYLDHLGYHLHRVEGGYGLDPGMRLEAADLSRWEHFDVMAISAVESARQAA